LAINIADEKVFLKNLGGSVISLSQTKDLSGAFASKSTPNTFTQLQSFSGGISGSLTGGAAIFPITTDNTSNAQRFILFANGAGYTSINIDNSSPRITYNPSTGALRSSVIEVGQTSPGLTLTSNGIISCDTGFSFQKINGSPVEGGIYFLTTDEVFFGDVFGEGNGTNMGMSVPQGNLFFGTTNQRGSFGMNMSFSGMTFGMECNHASGRCLRLRNNDATNISPTASVEFTTNSTGDLTIKPSGGDVFVSGSLTVTGTGLSGNVVVNNQLNVLAGATFAASTDVYFGGSTRGIYINGGKATSEIAAYGNTEINIDGYDGNGTISLRGYMVNMGDFDGNQNSTYITVDDAALAIYHEASSGHNFGGSRINALSGITAASLYISGGATFDGNTTIGNAATDTTTIYGSKVVNEFVFNNGTARTVGISWANGNVQLLGGTGSGATGATAIYFTGAPATGAASITLIVTNGGNMTGNTQFWANNIKWPGGNKPTLTAMGTDVVSFVTPDAGSTIYGFVGGLNFA